MSRPHLGVPYTIYPFSSDYAADLVTGLVSVYYRLNTNAIAQALRDAGLEVECLLDEWRKRGMKLPRKTKPPFFRVRRKDISLTIGDLPIQQMLFEGLQLEDFVTSIVSYFDEQIWNSFATKEGDFHKRPFQIFATYTNMEHIWASSRGCRTPLHYEDELTGEQVTL